MTHWSGSMTGHPTFWLTITAAFINPSWGQGQGSLAALVSRSLTKKDGSRPLVLMIPVSKVSLFLHSLFWDPKSPFSFSSFSGVGIAGLNESLLHVVFCHLLSFPQVLVSLGASEKLALLSLGNPSLPHSSPRPASAKHCRKLIHLLRPTHSTWSQISGVQPLAFVDLLLPTLLFLLYKPPTQPRAKKTKKERNCQLNWVENEKLEEIYV